jgi:hypothetical protein
MPRSFYLQRFNPSESPAKNRTWMSLSSTKEALPSKRAASITLRNPGPLKTAVAIRPSSFPKTSPTHFSFTDNQVEYIIQAASSHLPADFTCQNAPCVQTCFLTPQWILLTSCDCGVSWKRQPRPQYSLPNQTWLTPFDHSPFTDMRGMKQSFSVREVCVRVLPAKNINPVNTSRKYQMVKPNRILSARML